MTRTTLPPVHDRVVLVTGCSSGIGATTMDRLARAGMHVWATARRPASVEALKVTASTHAGQIHVAALDVTDSEQRADVVKRIIAKHGRIDALVNNAGYGQIGAVEDLDLATWQAQFDANLFGLIGLTQSVLPAMRKQKHGRIVNVSSVVAHLALPLMGAYCASKHALNAMSVSLRMELAAFGIDVVLVEPGPINTAFRDNAVDQAVDSERADTSPYARLYRQMQALWGSSFGDHGAPPSAVAKVIDHALNARKPRPCYRVTATARWAPMLTRLLPARMVDNTMLRQLRKAEKK